MLNLTLQFIPFKNDYPDVEEGTTLLVLEYLDSETPVIYSAICDDEGVYLSTIKLFLTFQEAEDKELLWARPGEIVFTVLHEGTDPQVCLKLPTNTESLKLDEVVHMVVQTVEGQRYIKRFIYKYGSLHTVTSGGILNTPGIEEYPDVKAYETLTKNKCIGWLHSYEITDVLSIPIKRAQG